MSMLNIGLSTLVEFLEKKTSLGEVKNDLNFKLNDEQYAALAASLISTRSLPMRTRFFLSADTCAFSSRSLRFSSFDFFLGRVL